MTSLHDTIALFTQRPEIRPQTARTYRNDLRAFAQYMGPDRPLVDISPVDMLRYAQHIAAQSAIQSPATYNKHVKSLRTFFNWCVKIGLVQQSPAAALQKKSQRKQIPKSKAMPQHHIDNLLRYTAHPKLRRAHALVRFLADTGCRIGGAANLTSDDLDLMRLTGHTYEKNNADKSGNAPNIVYFGVACREALQAWLVEQDAVRGRYVFSRDGAQIANQSLAQFFRRTCAEAGIYQPDGKTAYGPHSLRHAKGHQLANSGVDPTTAQAILNHERVETTLEHYYQQGKEHVERAARGLHTKPDQSRIIRPFRTGTED